MKRNGVRKDSGSFSTPEKKSDKQSHLDLLNRCDCPVYLLVGFINQGYRVHYSYKECFRSIFSRHNETSNIWTSIGLLLVLITWYPYVMMYELHYPSTSFLDYFVFSIYFIYLMFTALSR